MTEFDAAANGRKQVASVDLDSMVGEVRRVWRELRSQPLDELAATARQLRFEQGGVVEWNALAAEVTRRLRGVELHDGQLKAGVALGEGLTVEMRTGEGKTFAAIAPAAFYSAQGRHVHVVTANPYLAARDAEWSGGVLRALGFTTGVTIPGMSRDNTRLAYEADVVYGASSDFGFDFLRDGLVIAGDAVQRDLDVAIIDEADAVLLDEARTPLVLSGSTPVAVGDVQRVEAACRHLRTGHDVHLDLEHRRLALSDQGVAKVETALGISNLYSPGSIDWPHLVDNALRARIVLRRDLDYLVRDDRVLVVDEVTGRVVEGRRWSEGLHQAVEAKEELPITSDRRALGRITVGGYFSNYRALLGMSGTLEGADDELAAAHAMTCIRIAPHKPVLRRDHPDASYSDTATKYAGVADDVARRHAIGQPVLIGTVSIAASETFSQLLRDWGIPHRSLSAKNDAAEAAIIAQAGQPGAVTVATQMAGRGVDIVLGGTSRGPEQRAHAAAVGGLMVWGLDHHPAHRLDMQLRGRSGRQGEPGETRFAASPDDDLTALAPGAPPPEAVAQGQAAAEKLDRDLRDDTRATEAATDRLHEQLYSWRRRIAAATTLDEELAHAVNVTATAVLGGAPWPHGLPSLHLPRWKRRHPFVDAHLLATLEQRGAHHGEPLWTQASQLVLQTLLVVVWADELDRLEHQKHLSRLTPAFDGALPDLGTQAESSYRHFVRAVQLEWVHQLLALSIVDGDQTSGERSPVDIPLPAASAQAEDSEPVLHGHWEGWSFNAAVRRHFGTKLPEPQLVLTIDSIGDTPNRHGLRLHLDLDDPTATSVFRSSDE